MTGLRPDIQAFPGQEFARPHLVEEHERADGAALNRRQGAPDLEPADIGGTGNDDRFD